jgi:hypothetical protein
MKLRSSRSTLLVTLVALLAGTSGAVIASVGTAVAGPVSVTSVASEIGSGVGQHLVKPKKGKGKKSKSLNPKKIKQLADKQIAAWAPTGSVGHADTATSSTNAGNAGALGGQPPSAYTTNVLTVPLSPFTAPATGSSSLRIKNWTLPSVPAGTYLATLSLSAEVSSSNASLYCALYQDGQDADLLTAYGAASTGVFRTVGASQLITVNNTVRVQCQALTNTGYRLISVPADNAYAPAQVSFVKVDAATGLGTAN